MEAGAGRTGAREVVTCDDNTMIDDDRRRNDDDYEHDVECFFSFRWGRRDRFRPKIIKIGAILEIFRPFEVSPLDLTMDWILDSTLDSTSDSTSDSTPIRPWSRPWI